MAGRRTEHPRVRSAIQSVVLASTGLLWAATLPSVLAAGTDAVTEVIIVVSLIVLLTRKVERLSSNVHKFPFHEVSPNLHTGGIEGRSDSLGHGKLSAVETPVARLLAAARTCWICIQRLAHLTPAGWVAQIS
jgi:hypothetical protein